MSEKELLLGDNPFFGIDHLSQEKARMRKKILDSYDKILEIMNYVSDLGIKGFVVSTHPQLKDLIKLMRKDSLILEKFDFYPILPYAQGYVDKVTEKGILNAVTDVLSTGKTTSKLKIIFKGTTSFLKKDFDKLFQTFIDVELLPLTPTKKKIIFLHDAVTDLSINLEMKNVIENFINYVKDQYKVEAGLVTKNFPKSIKTLREWDIQIPPIMTSFNPIGYQMNPSKEECERYISNSQTIAMNVLAGGYLKPKESFQYLSKLDIKTIVVGMSNKERAQETISDFKEFCR